MVGTAASRGRRRALVARWAGACNSKGHHVAVRERRGWVWTPSEKAWARRWQRSLARRVAHVAEQGRRFTTSIPGHGAEATTLAACVAGRAQPLLAIDARRNSRTCQAISPERARMTLVQLDREWSAWLAFAARPDVVAAIRRVGRS